MDRIQSVHALDKQILRDVRNALNMSSSMFPTMEQVKEYWKDKADEEKKEEQAQP